MTLSGLVVGGIAALAATRLLTTLLFGIRPTDPGTYAAIAVTVLAVTFVAGYAPPAARRGSIRSTRCERDRVG
ncbi:MAG: hypothetical protein ACT4P7_02075 [Gemmatimonadaceae bacterium]